MIIRELQELDISQLSNLLSQLGYPTSENNLEARYKTILADTNYQTFIAEENGVVIGMIGLSKGLFYEMDGFYVRIVSLIVDANYRRRGVGKKLVEEAENWGRHLGAKGIGLNSGNRPERATAHKFYKDLGYSEKSIGFAKKFN